MADNDLNIVLPGVTLTKTSLIIPDGMQFGDWEALGGKLRQFSGAVRWWIADWIRFGQHAYGDMYWQAVDETGFDYDYLKNIVWVASRFEPSRRHDLSFSHHQAVAGLVPSTADDLLNQCEEEKWTRAELRERVNLIKLPAPKPIEEPINDVSFWYKDSRVIAALEGIKALSVAVRLLEGTSSGREEARQILEAWLNQTGDINNQIAKILGGKDG